VCFILNLTVHPEYEFVTNVSICEGGIYSWRGSDYSVSGTYIDSFLTVNFCDSVYGLNLTVHPVYELVTNVDICEGDVYLWRGNMYSVSGVFLDSLLTAYSCDSVHVLNLTVHPAYEFTTNAEICEGQQYTWNDNFYDTSGTYTLNDITINGCDSIHILNLFVHQSYEFVTYAEICDNDIYTWKNNEYSNPGIYYDNLQTIYGCDSIYILNLAVHPVYEYATNAYVCDGNAYSWRGNLYSVSGVFIDSLLTGNLCDSTYILNLFVEPGYEFVSAVEICHGVKYFWRGMEYSNAGTYSINYYTINNCDSSYTLNLTVYPTPEAGFLVSESTVFEDDATIYFTDESEEASSWYWDFGTGSTYDNSNLQNPVFTFPGIGEYIVWQYVENIQGCNDSASVLIHVRPIVTLYFPNAFSPNGDGSNDEFYLIGINIDPVLFRMFIYDRWGKLIFTSNDINISWNGKVMGSNIIAPIGVYTWIIEYTELDSNNNYFFNKTGTVTLIK
jgi:gliding motility-associated-like protein